MRNSRRVKQKPTHADVAGVIISCVCVRDARLWMITVASRALTVPGCIPTMHLCHNVTQLDGSTDKWYSCKSKKLSAYPLVEC